MERVRMAVEMFENGYSCAQSLLASFGLGFGLDREMALKIASPLGGGLSRTDGPCGAATGAILVLGLAHGHTGPEDEEGQERIRSMTQEYLRRYDKRKGSTFCTDILGANLSEAGEPERVKAEGLAAEACPDAVRAAGQILLEML